jgi:putative NADH-flavin reductase
MVATGDIVPGERTGVYRTLEDVLPEGARKISVEDVADFLLKSLRDSTHLQKRVGAGY